VEKALRAPTRERIHERADEATFARRAQAVDKERAIAENELQNRIELAGREEHLVEQESSNQRRRAEAQAEQTDVIEAANLRAERERAEIQASVPPAVLLALALQELAGQLGQIDHLTITPDLVTPLLTSLQNGAGAKGSTTGATPERPGPRDRAGVEGQGLMLPRAVLVQRPTEYEALLARHGTREQARFFLAERDRTLEEVQQRHAIVEDARRGVLGAIPPDWRRALSTATSSTASCSSPTT
jgi:hypothetical protein